MGLELVEKLYAAEDFTALSEHNAQTPATFFGATPVLHLSCPKSTIHFDREALAIAPVLAKLSDSDTTGEGQLTFENIDIWVTSKFLALSSEATSTSIRIDYPTIAVHGQKDNSVMVLLRIQPDVPDDEDEEECAQLHILPTNAEHDAVPTEDASSMTNGGGPKHYASLLYTAIGDCQELNPDPEDDEDGDNGDEAPGFPGGGGWITSENMHEFVDEEGNLRTTTTDTEASLGPGAGNVRTADDATLNNEDDDASKWQRTD